MHGAVHPVMPCIFEDEEDSYLVGDGDEGGEGNVGSHAEVFGHWVEEVDLREFDCEVGEEDKFCAGPLFGCCGDFVLRGENELVVVFDLWGGLGWMNR